MAKKTKLMEAAEKILSEGAAEIFNQNINQKGTGDPFGVGMGNLPTPPQNLGNAGTRSTDPNYPAQNAVPVATPPGVPPQPGDQNPSQLPTQPQQVMGRTDLAVSPEDMPDSQYQEIRDRIMGKTPPQYFQSNPGAIPPYVPESYKEDLEAIFNGESLDEEFKLKISTIFEAAVNAKVEEKVAIKEEELTQEFNEAVEIVKEELSTKLNDYINYIAEEWMKENQLAVEKGIKAEIYEDFMESIKNVFLEHYIDIPEEKVNVIEELTSKVDSLKEDLNSQITKNIELSKLISESRKKDIVASICEGLTLTQAEKIKTLATGVEFTTEDDYSSKVKIIKENYFPTLSSQTPATQQQLVEDTFVEQDSKQVEYSFDPMVDMVARAISKTKIK